MTKYIVKRLTELLPLLLIVSFAAFIIVRVLPVDPATSYLDSINVPVNEESLRSVQAEMGLDKPLYVQYAIWFKKAVTLDLGVSYLTKNTVTSELGQGLRYTVMLAGAAMVWVAAVSLPLGMAAALRPQGILNGFIRIFTFLGASIPEFWLGYLLVHLFSVRLGLLPVAGATSPACLILPSATLACSHIATYTKLLRNSMLENMSLRYALYAKTRGLSEWAVIFRHVLPNSLNPVITSLGLNLGGMLSGSVIVENVFSWPGLGQRIVGAVAGRDYPVIQGYIVVIAAVFIACNLLADVGCCLLNPKIKLEV